MRVRFQLTSKIFRIIQTAQDLSFVGLQVVDLSSVEFRIAFIVSFKL